MASCSERAALDEAEKQRKLADIEFKKMLKVVMDTTEGRAFLRWVLSECGVDQPNLRTETALMFAWEGARAVGITIREKVKQELPDQFFKMFQEGFYDNK
jgi:hypothetical protein